MIGSPYNRVGGHWFARMNQKLKTGGVNKIVDVALKVPRSLQTYQNVAERLFDDHSALLL